MFKIWKGATYGQPENGPKTLILGESHYGYHHDTYGYALEDKSILCVTNHMNGWKHRYFTNIVSTVTGKYPTLEEKRTFWNSVCFHDLITTPLSGPGVAPTFDQWNVSIPTLQRVIAEVDPEFLVVVCSRMWDRVSTLDYFEALPAQYPVGMKPAKRLKPTGAVAVSTKHPSRFYSWRKYHPHIQFGKLLLARTV